MSTARSDYVSRVIELYLGAPDTADVPRDNGWPIAGAMYDAGIPLEVVEHAFHTAFLRELGTTYHIITTLAQLPWNWMFRYPLECRQEKNATLNDRCSVELAQNK